MDSITSSDKFIYTFNFLKLLQFFEKNGLVTTALIAVLSYRMNDLTNDFFTFIILPIVNCEYKGKKVEDFEINLAGVNFKIGKMVLSILKAIIIIYIMYLIAFIIKTLEDESK